MKTIWTTQCVIGNIINMYDTDWAHILDGHPEMTGKEHLVKLAIENPDYVQEGGNAKAAAYVLPADNEHDEGVRVLVNFSSEMWIIGSKIGDVSTGYPIDTEHYPNPDLGKIIWKKGGLR